MPTRVTPVNLPTDLYNVSLALLTDFYQLTMAYGYWKAGLHGREAVFQMFFRRNPFGGGFTVACGQAYLLDYVSRLHFDEGDLAYVAALTGNDGRPLFEPGFLAFLREFRCEDPRFACDIDAVPEGTVVFPHEPLVRVRGPLLTCQLLETPLLNCMNFQTLIATKAARVCLAAGNEPVLEFGLRRAQGIDGGLSASRAAYVGGCAFTSNVLAARLWGIPVAGTHAHSWIMAFDTELEAFQAFADALPNNCTLLVDTYDTLQGVRHAAEVGQSLRRRGHQLAAIRLDSGDLAYLSKEARRILDDAGLHETRILASNDLDEHIIASLRQQGAPIVVWGVGTRLVTGHGDPALGGIYKMTAIRNAAGRWQPAIKLSEQAAKITTPGMLQVRRFEEGGLYVADMIYDESRSLSSAGSGQQVGPPPDGGGSYTIVDPADFTRRKQIPADTPHVELLLPFFRRGARVVAPWTLADARRRAAEQLGKLHESIKRFVNPHLYPAGLELSLHDVKTELYLQKKRG
ncbi:MAG: nicotinate phosphoribosyltransferase [Planctomycetota bacterium]